MLHISKFSLRVSFVPKNGSSLDSSLIKNKKFCDKICKAMALLTRLKKELAFHWDKTSIFIFIYNFPLVLLVFSALSKVYRNIAT